MTKFEFFNPVKLIYGENEIDRIGSETARYGRKALIVSYTDISFYGDLFERVH